MARYSSGRQYVTTHMPVYIKTAERIEFVFGRSFAAKTVSNLCVDNRLRPRCPICCRCIRRKSGASGYRQFVAEIICTLRSRISLTTACVTWLVVLGFVVLNVVQDVDITLELSGKLLRLVDSSKGSELFSQRLHSVRQWSTGPGKNRYGVRCTCISLSVHLSKLSCR